MANEVIEAIAKQIATTHYDEDSKYTVEEQVRKLAEAILALHGKCDRCEDGKTFDCDAEENEDAIIDCPICHSSGLDPEPLLFTKEALKEAGYVQLAEDQSLPEIPFLPSHLYDTPDRAYSEAQQDMIAQGWRKTEVRK